MADVTVEYTQGPTGPGEITLTIDGAPTTVAASGRLDAVGNRVVSPKIDAFGTYVVVECIRTSSVAMRVVLVIGDAFDYGGSLKAGIVGERVIENVPLDFG